MIRDHIPDPLPRPIPSTLADDEPTAHTVEETCPMLAEPYPLLNAFHRCTPDCFGGRVRVFRYLYLPLVRVSFPEEDDEQCVR